MSERDHKGRFLPGSNTVQAKGGKAKVKKGFAVNKELARKAGAKGLRKRYQDHE